MANIPDNSNEVARPRARRRRFWWLALLILPLLFGSCAGTGSRATPSWTENAANNWRFTPETKPDREAELRAIAAAYAPVLLHDSLPPHRLNVPVAYTYDEAALRERREAAGDDSPVPGATDNQQNIYDETIPLLPTVYYAIVTTETHAFITYSLYHAADRWQHGGLRLANPLRVGGTHEGDGENIQLVVELPADGPLTDGQVIMAYSQHHNSEDYAAASADIPGMRRLYFDDQAAGGGKHPLFDVEAGKHGILVHEPGKARGWRSGRAIQYRFSAAPDGVEATPFDPAAREFRYRLLPIESDCWRRYLDSPETADPAAAELAGRATGDLDRYWGGAFDLALQREPEAPVYRYHQLPRHYRADELSVFYTRKYNAGMAPYYLAGGHMFFDPAWHWSQRLPDPADWSLDYTHNPYLPLEHDGMSAYQPDSRSGEAVTMSSPASGRGSAADRSSPHTGPGSAETP